MPDAAVSEPAPAKLNLFLRVLGKRADGFHDIDSIVQPLTLADGVQARLGDGEVSLVVVGECAADVPRDRDNLVVRAARAMAEAFDERRGAAVLLQKRVPVAAGLGGGSSDAAATLRALDRLWACGAGPARLAEIGASLGSDVPSQVHGLPVRVGGRGEVVERVHVLRTWWVLVTLPFRVRAAEAYAWWDEDGGRSGPEPSSLLEALAGGDPERVAGQLFNDLEGPVASRYPDVAEARAHLVDAGALGAVMCGSGPTVAGLARDGHHAEELAAATNGIVVGSITRSVS
jgi:4-diphosphocytidyl-2-C-methyl-D-erythritol kinase